MNAPEYLRGFLTSLALGVSAMTLTACPENKGTMEQAGEKVDEAVEEAQDTVEEAKDSVEEAADSVEEAKDSVEEETE